MAARRFPRGGVAAPHYLASTAGLVTLARGGNAIDAAIAANLALGVVAPYLCGYGGWFDLLERWGTRSFGELAEPALAYARDGFELTPTGAMYLGGSLAMY